jgi:hypothetical protein
MNINKIGTKENMSKSKMNMTETKKNHKYDQDWEAHARDKPRKS